MDCGIVSLPVKTVGIVFSSTSVLILCPVSRILLSLQTVTHLGRRPHRPDHALEQLHARLLAGLAQADAHVLQQRRVADKRRQRVARHVGRPLVLGRVGGSDANVARLERFELLLRAEFVGHGGGGGGGGGVVEWVKGKARLDWAVATFGCLSIAVGARCDDAQSQYSVAPYNTHTSSRLQYFTRSTKPQYYTQYYTQSLPPHTHGRHVCPPPYARALLVAHLARHRLLPPHSPLQRGV